MRWFQEQLSRRAMLGGINVDAATVARLGGYLDLLTFWNRRMNLAGFSLDPPSDEAIDRLFIEPLAAAAAVARPVGSLVDIGSGGGSPGLMMAVALEPSRTVLVESVAKKGVFLREAARVLGLNDSVEVMVERVERLDIEALGCFDLLTTRAIRLAAPVAGALAGLVCGGGQLCIFRTAADAEEVSGTPGTSNPRIVPLGPGGRSVAVILCRS